MDDRPLLVLPPRYTEDSIALGGAAVQAGWGVERLAGWRVPEWLAAESRGGREVAVYGEPLFVAAVAGPLGIIALEPSAGWLAGLPPEYRLREVRGSAWGSGVYGCDPEEVLRVVRRSCVREAGASEEDRCRVVERRE